MPQVLCHENNSDGGNQDHCVRMEARCCEVWQANPGSIPQVGKVNRFSESKPIGKQEVEKVANNAAYQNGKTTKRPWRIDSNERNSKDGDKRHPGIKRAGSGFRNGCWRQVQTNDRDNNTSNRRWHEVLNPPIAREYDNHADDGIDNSRSDNAAKCNA